MAIGERSKRRDGRGAAQRATARLALMPNDLPTVVAGDGQAGLACAGELVRGGLTVQSIEEFVAAGGRARTDAVDGFLLDR